MRNGEHRRGVRASALWGSGKRGTGSRSNALWGSGKRRTALLATLALVVLVPFGASASPSKADAPSAFVTPSLFSAAQSNAAGSFDVIVQGKGGNQAAKALADVLGTDKKAYKDFRSIDGIAVQLSGAQVLALAGDKHISAITPDSRVRLSRRPCGPTSCRAPWSGSATSSTYRSCARSRARPWRRRAASAPSCRRGRPLRPPGGR